MRADILSLVSETVAAFKELDITPEIWGTSFKRVALEMERRKPESKSRKLHEALSTYEPLNLLFTGWWDYPDGGGQAAQGSAVTHFLLDTALEGESVSDGLASLEALCRQRRSNFTWYAAILGPRIDGRVELGAGIELVPWDQLSEPERPTDDYDLISIGDFKMPPTSALRVSVADFEIISQQWSGQTTDWLTDLRSRSRFEEFRAVVKSVTRCLSVGENVACAEACYWPRFEPPVASFVGTRIGTTRALKDPWVYGSDRVMKGERLMKLFHGLSKFEEKGLSSMRIGMDRLNSSRGARELADRAIDLGIAVEAILLHDQKDKTNLGYRIGVRGAAFLHQNGEKRMASFKLFKDVYNIRSEVAHSGRLKKSKIEGGNKTLEEGSIELCLVIEKLLDRGSFPDFEAEYILKSAEPRRRDGEDN